MKTYNVEILHPDLSAYKLFVDDVLVSEGECVKTQMFKNISGKISIWYEPWKIYPEIRIDDFLVNYALAEVDVYEHKLDFVLEEDFITQYRANDIASREKAVFDGKGEVDKYIYDAVIGINSDHRDIVESIKKVLNHE